MMTGVNMVHVPYRGDRSAEIIQRSQRRAAWVSQECPGEQSDRAKSGQPINMRTFLGDAARRPPPRIARSS